MKIGTGLFTGQRRPDDDRSMGDIYDEILTLGRAIDDADLDSAWVSEHHFAEDGYLSGTMPTLGALAAVTDDIEIGTCIALAPLYDGVRLAEDAATVDLLSDGRATLGLAIGSNPDEFDAFGVPQAERVERLEDHVNLLRAAWSAGPLDYDADFHDVTPEMSVTPKPDRDVPVMLGGSAKPAVRRAARTADAWCAPSKLSPSGIETRVNDIHTIREEEEIDGEFTVYALVHGWVGDSREAAWETMKSGYFYLQRRYAEIFSGKSVQELSAERKQELKEQAIFGTPEQVVAELDRYRMAASDDVHVIFRTYHPGVGTGAMIECVDRLGSEVAPKI